MSVYIVGGHTHLIILNVSGADLCGGKFAMLFFSGFNFILTVFCFLALARKSV